MVLTCARLCRIRPGGAACGHEAGRPRLLCCLCAAVVIVLASCSILLFNIRAMDVRPRLINATAGESVVNGVSAYMQQLGGTHSFVPMPTSITTTSSIIELTDSMPTIRDRWKVKTDSYANTTVTTSTTACEWIKHKGHVSVGHSDVQPQVVIGARTVFLSQDLVDAQMLCLGHLSVCKAVTCISDQDCTLRSSEVLTPSPLLEEATYLPGESCFRLGITSVRTPNLSIWDRDMPRSGLVREVFEEKPLGSTCPQCFGQSCVRCLKTGRPGWKEAFYWPSSQNSNFYEVQRVLVDKGVKWITGHKKSISGWCYLLCNPTFWNWLPFADAVGLCG